MGRGERDNHIPSPHAIPVKLKSPLNPTCPRLGLGGHSDSHNHGKISTRHILTYITVDSSYTWV